MPRSGIVVGGESVRPGRRKTIRIPLSRLPTGSELAMSVDVLHGAEPGPTLWLSGAIHGDEIVGVEIIRLVLQRIDPKALAGTILAVPVVNVFGFIAESRYLPDRRDLNRSFPGSKRGSHAARLARLFMDEVVGHADIGLDFHAGSNDRTNLPQIRGNLDDAETKRMALAFAPPLVIHAKSIKGSLRQAAVKKGKRVLLYEGGEPRRFSPRAVDDGLAGTLRLLDALGMTSSDAPQSTTPTQIATSTRWVRASRGGIFRLERRLGDQIEKGDRIGAIGDPSTRGTQVIRATATGTLMGHAVNPLVHRGDALAHIALHD